MLSRSCLSTGLCLALLATCGCGYFQRHVVRNRGETRAPAAATGPTRVSTPREKPATRENELAGLEARIEADADKLERGDYALRVNRTLIYPMQWLRAEDVADTLADLLISQYGPNTRVIAHADTNQLLIYLPPPAEWSSRGGPGASRRGAAPDRGAAAAR